MRLEPIGHRDDVEVPAPPENIVVPIVVYEYVKSKDGKGLATFDAEGKPKTREREVEFTFTGMTQIGIGLRSLRMISSIDGLAGDERVTQLGKATIAALDRWVIDADKERWAKLVEDPNTFVPLDTLIEVYRALMKVYADGNPTMQRSDSPSTRSRRGGTSGAAARKTASTSKAARSRTASR